VEAWIHVFLTLAPDGGERLASRPWQLHIWYPLDSRLDGPRADLDAVQKRKNSSHAPARNWTPVVQPVTYSLYWLSYHGCILGSIFLLMFSQKSDTTSNYLHGRKIPKFQSYLACDQTVVKIYKKNSHLISKYHIFRGSSLCIRRLRKSTLANLSAAGNVIVQVEVFWVVTHCSVVVGYRRFGFPCCLNIHLPQH